MGYNISRDHISYVCELYLKMQEFKVDFLANEDNVSKRKGLLMDFLSFNCYGGKCGKDMVGFLYKTGYLTSLIDKHNRSYTYLSDKNWRSRAKGEKVPDSDISKKKTYSDDFCPFYIEDIDETSKNQRGEFTSDFKEEFLKEKSARNTSIELLAKCMHWSNKSAKCIDKIMSDNFSKDELKKYGNAYRKVSRFGISEALSYYTKFSGYDDKTDYEEIIRRFGEDEYSNYLNIQKRMMAELSKNPNLKHLSFEKVMQYALLKKTRALSYSMKNIFTQRTIAEIEKTQNKGALHYLRQDEEADENDPYKYVYGVSIEGYTEPFEVHVCSDPKDLNNFDLNLSLAEGMLKKEGISKKISIPVIEEYMLVKTGTPFKLRDRLKNVLSGLAKSKEFSLKTFVSDAIDASKMLDPVTGDRMSPQAYTIVQSLECQRIMQKSIDKSEIKYTKDGASIAKGIGE